VCRGKVIADTEIAEDTIVAELGRIITPAARMATSQPRDPAALDMDKVREVRAQIPVSSQRRFDVYPDVSGPREQSHEHASHD
jgi:hypothetical protein